MNETFYKRCKKVVAELDLSYEQGIARDVILNELDLLEKQVADYQKRFSKAIEYIKRELLQEQVEYYKNNKYNVTISGTDIMAYEIVDLLDILKGEDNDR